MMPVVPRDCRAGTRRLVGATLAVVVVLASTLQAADTASDVATRTLLERLEERRMPDVAVWVLDRVVADPSASAELKAEVPFRRALALVGIGRTQADATKRAAQFEQALGQIDEFLKASPQGRRAIDAYTQKGNLLIEQARVRLEQAKRPGANVAALRAEAVGFYDRAIEALQGTVKPGQEITAVTNAEDAVLKEWRDARAKVAELRPKETDKDADSKGDGKKPPAKKPRRDPATDKQLERLDAEVESLQGQLVQARLMTASAYYEKARAYDEKSKEWTAALEESTRRYKELADKYPTLGGGVLARYYEGRNLAALGRRDEAVSKLAALVLLEDPSPLAVTLRTKAVATTLECWLADKKFDAFDQKMRDFALDERKLLRLAPEPDRLALKYRTALMLQQLAAGGASKDAAQSRALLVDAGKLAMEVARVNREFADEARDLLKSLGKDVVNAADADFDGILADAKAALQTMQAKQLEAKNLQAANQDATAALAAAAAARDEALSKFDQALARAEAQPQTSAAVPEAGLSYARSMRTFLLYDAKRYAEAAELGGMLVERYPNASGSRQAGMVAMASLQQLAKGSDAAAAAAAKERLQAVARTIAAMYPADKEGMEAVGILVGAAIDARNPQAVIELIDALPAAASNRPQLLARAGTFLWREVLEQGRTDDAARANADAVAAWKSKSRSHLDEALRSPPGSGTGLRIMASAALARAQLALDDGDAATAIAILEAPGTGPWTLVNDATADATLREGSFAETALTVALRSFIQAEQLDKAQQAMDRLETLAGAGGSEEQSARLTAMYLSMGRELQEQLERLGGDRAADPQARQKAVAILGGFEKFLDGLAKRDPKVASQIWVATTYLTLGSGRGTGAVVPKAKAEQYLDRAAEVYGGLLGRKGEPEVARFEPSIRLKMASIYRERGKWKESLDQIDWILADPKRQNSLETQTQAAEILQATAQSLAATDAAAAEVKFREATAGRTGGRVVIWGWGGIAGKIGRQAFSGTDDKALKARELFFTARLNQAACLLGRAQLPGKSPDQVRDLLGKAEAAVALTRKLNPDLGGPALESRFEKLLKDIQRQQGVANPRGFAALDEQTAATPPAAVNP